jgi:hypothetical protein
MVRGCISHAEFQQEDSAEGRAPALTLTNHHLLRKGDDMAVSKHSRPSGCETNPFFLELFRDRPQVEERERMWHMAISHAGEGTPPLRFPVYETLYLINVYSQKLVDLLDEVGQRFGIDSGSREYHQSMIQMVRASASEGIMNHMNDIETTEEWLFERLWFKEQKKLRDPDDAYLDVRNQEAERIEQGLPPRVQFLDEPLIVRPSASAGTPHPPSVPEQDGEDE